MGNFPVDANKYKKSQLDKLKLDSYHVWKENEAPAEEDGIPILSKTFGES